MKPICILWITNNKYLKMGEESMRRKNWLEKIDFFLSSDFKTKPLGKQLMRVQQLKMYNSEK